MQIGILLMQLQYTTHHIMIPILSARTLLIRATPLTEDNLHIKDWHQSVWIWEFHCSSLSQSILYFVLRPVSGVHLSLDIGSMGLLWHPA